MAEHKFPIINSITPLLQASSLGYFEIAWTYSYGNPVGGYNIYRFIGEYPNNPTINPIINNEDWELLSNTTEETYIDYLNGVSETVKQQIFKTKRKLYYKIVAINNERVQFNSLPFIFIAYGGGLTCKSTVRQVKFNNLYDEGEDIWYQNASSLGTIGNINCISVDANFYDRQGLVWFTSTNGSTGKATVVDIKTGGSLFKHQYSFAFPVYGIRVDPTTGDAIVTGKYASLIKCFLNVNGATQNIGSTSLGLGAYGGNALTLTTSSSGSLNASTIWKRHCVLNWNTTTPGLASLVDPIHYGGCVDGVDNNFGITTGPDQEVFVNGHQVVTVTWPEHHVGTRRIYSPWWQCEKTGGSSGCPGSGYSTVSYAYRDEPYDYWTTETNTIYKDVGILYKTTSPVNVSATFTDCADTAHTLYDCGRGNVEGKQAQDPNTLGTYEGVTPDIPTTLLSPTNYNLWQSDQVEDKVHKISWNGTTLQDTGFEFDIENPTDVAVDSENNVWGISIADAHKKHYQIPAGGTFPTQGNCLWPASAAGLWNYGSYFNDEYVEYVLTRDPVYMYDPNAVALWNSVYNAPEGQKRGFARTWMREYGSTYTVGLSVYPNFTPGGTYSIARSYVTNTTQPNSDETGLGYIYANNLQYFSHPAIGHPEPTYPIVQLILQGIASNPVLGDTNFWNDQIQSNTLGTSGYDDFTISLTLSTINQHTFELYGYNFKYDDKVVDVCGDVACNCANNYPACGQNPVSYVSLNGSRSTSNTDVYTYHDPSQSGKPLVRRNGWPGENNGTYTPTATAYGNSNCYLMSGDYSTFYDGITTYGGQELGAVDPEDRNVEVYERWPTAEFYVTPYDNTNCTPTAWGNWSPITPAGDNGLDLTDADRIVSGYDPLSASFTDFSIGRTWPISSWYWTFGDELTYGGFTLPVLSPECGGPHVLTQFISTDDPEYSPRDNYSDYIENMTNHFYRGPGWYTATLYVKASNTGTDSWNISSGVTNYFEMSSNFTVAASRRIYVKEACPEVSFVLVSGATVPASYSDDSRFFDVGLSGNAAYQSPDGLFISGYAPNLTVVWDNTGIARSLPLSAFRWTFNDYYNEVAIYNDSYGQNRDNSNILNVYISASPISGWPTWELPPGEDYTGRAIHTFVMPGYYTVSLNAYSSSDLSTGACNICSIPRHVYVEEIPPQACFTIDVSTGESPLTVSIDPGCTIPGSFPVCRIDYDFGDGSGIYSVSVLDNYPWTPAYDLDSLVAWFDATDSTTVHFNSLLAPRISAWDDKSGNGYHLNDITSRGAVTSQVSYGNGQINGLSSVNFYNTWDRIMRTGIPDISATDGVSIVAVAEFTGGIYNNIAEMSNTAQTDKVLARRRATNDRLAGVISVNGSAVQPSMSTAVTAYSNGTPFIASVYYDNDRGYIDGNGGTDIASGDLPDDQTFVINFLGMGRTSTDTCNHKTGEVIMLKTSDIETRQKVEGYLAWKWNLQDSLPSNHPYKDKYPIMNHMAYIPISHEYTRTLTPQPSTFTLWMSAYACNTNTVDVASASIGPINLPGAIDISKNIHLIKNRMYNKDNDILYVFENNNNLETYNVILSAEDE